MNRIIIALFLGAILLDHARADDRLVGSWVKDHTRQEDHVYPGDTNWNLQVIFRADGKVVWRSTRTEGTNTIDESVTGTYSVHRAMITFQFDKPSSDALKRLPDWFAFSPSQMKGQQIVRLEKDSMVLANEGRKLSIHMKRTVDPSGGGSTPQK